MYLSKRSVMLLVFCFFTTTWALECHICNDCDEEDTEPYEAYETCEEYEKCAKITAIYKDPGIKVIRKQCLDDSIAWEEQVGPIDNNIRVELNRSQPYKLGNVVMHYDICNEDLCNGVSVFLYSPFFIATCLLAAISTLNCVLR